MVDIPKLLNNRIFSVAALVVVVLGFMATLWWMSLFFIVGPDPLPVEVSADASARDVPDIPIDRIVAMNLFGEPTRDAAPRSEKLSETKLSLVLHGVFVADKADASTALISQRNNNPKLYAISDRLPGNARLEEVYRDRVVVSRGGVRENLSFKRGDQMIRPGVRRSNADRAESSAHRQASSPRAQRNPRSLIARTLAKHRDEIDRDPRKFIETLGLTTSERGGYVLGTFADHDTGLEPGDRLLSLNGTPVGNPEEDRHQLERILAGRSVEVQIQRGEQRITFSLSLDSLN
ncbi:MAG: PDZ domain-containing protein [Gammaproteobacteria bacterium]|nr:PDZ domain-containing protein [Gammaproteobacteria bacterium]